MPRSPSPPTPANASGRGQPAEPGSGPLFEAIFAEASDAILIADDQGHYIAANRAAGELLGRSPGEIVGRRAGDFVSPSVDAGAVWKGFLERGRLRGDYQITRPDGSLRDVEFNAVANVLPGRHLSILRDVTERKKAEAALRRTEARLGALFHSNIMNITFGNTRGEIIEANDAFLQMVGRSREDLEAGLLNWPALTPPEHRGINNEAQDSLRLTGEALPFQKQYLRSDGKRPWVLLGLARLPGSEGGTVAVSIDITREKEAELARLESERKLAAIFSSSPVGIFIGELPSCRILEANRAFVELMGRPEADILGKRSHELGFGREPGLRESVIDRLSAGEVVRNVETVFETSSGGRRQLLMSLDGLGLEGRPNLFMAMVADVTDRHVLEDQLRQAQKMEAIGRLAGGIAHDFNNLLTAIIGYAELVQHDESVTPSIHTDVGEILKAAQSAAGLTRQLLAFSRRQVLQPRVLDLNHTVRHIESILRRVLGEDVVLTTTLADPLGLVSADPAQIEQVLMNLAINARDAMPGGGQVHIETANVRLDAACAEAHRAASSGPYVLLAVSDTGTGMDDAVRSRLFEPFFTTKEQGKGTGLGLATAYGAIRQMGGAIRVDSALGQGTTFNIYLPITANPLTEPARVVLSPSLGGSETILLAEDQDDVRRVAAQILTRHGYTVLQAAGAREALRLGRDPEVCFDLLLTDVVMPEMSGRELARALHTVRPGLRVLYTSGYTDDAIVHHGVLDAGLAFAQKPFTPHSLLQQVRQALDSPEPPPV